MNKNITFEKLEPYVYVTKLAGFEHSEFIQPNATKKPKLETDIPMVQGKNIRDGVFVEKYDWYISRNISDSLPRSVLNKKCILIPYVGSNLGEVGIFPNKYRCHLASNIAKLELINDKFDLEYLMYYFQSPIGQSYLFKDKQGSSQPNITMESIRNSKVIIKPIIEQKKIAKILSKISRKIENNNAINNNLQELMNTFYDYYFIKQTQNNVSNCSKLLCKDILEVKTGKEDANFGNSNGKYKFFTCSKETINCDKPAFSGQSILIAGNGDFNVKHYNGEFNAYQRTYVLIPSDSLYYGTLYMSALKLVQKFRKASSGSIVKFISKSDVENIEIIIPNNHNLLLSLNKYLDYIEKNEKENERLIKIRNFIVPLLMNGQATIDE